MTGLLPSGSELKVMREWQEALAQARAPLRQIEVGKLRSALEDTPQLGRRWTPDEVSLSNFLQRLPLGISRYVDDVANNAAAEGHTSWRERQVDFLKEVMLNPLALRSARAPGRQPEAVIRAVLYWMSDVRLSANPYRSDPELRVAAAQEAAVGFYETLRRKRGGRDRTDEWDGQPLRDFLAHVHGAARDLGVPLKLPANETLSGINLEDEVAPHKSILLELILACREVAVGRAEEFLPCLSPSHKEDALEIVAWHRGKSDRQIVELLRELRRRIR